LFNRDPPMEMSDVDLLKTRSVPRVECENTAFTAPPPLSRTIQLNVKRKKRKECISKAVWIVGPAGRRPPAAPQGRDLLD